MNYLNKILILIGIMTVISYPVVADNGSEDGKDYRNFDKGSNVKVWLHYESFEDIFADELPSFTRSNMELAIKTVIDNWIQITGINLNVEYAGVRNTSNVDRGEILIFAGERLNSDIVPARALQSDSSQNVPNYSHIQFFRAASNGRDFEWTVYPTDDVDNISFIGVLMHEMGHAFGLWHNSNEDGDDDEIAQLRSVMYPQYNNWRRFGPYAEDIEDIQDLYGVRKTPKLSTFLSTNNADSWNEITSNVNYLNTTMPVDAIYDGASGHRRMLMFYADSNKKINFRIGTNLDEQNSSATSVTWEGNRRFNIRSLYGVTGDGNGSEYMITWVGLDDNRVRVLYTNNAGDSWRYLNPPSGNFQSRAGGTPAVAKLWSNGWILAYVKLDESPRGDSGKVVFRISKDDGRTWSDEREMNAPRKFRGLRGVTIAQRSSFDIDVRIGFAQARNEDNWASAVTTLVAHVDMNSGDLVFDASTLNTGVKTSTEPFYAASGYWLMGYRPTDGVIASRRADIGSTSWKDKEVIQSGYHPLPLSITSYSGITNRAYMFVLE